MCSRHNANTVTIAMAHSVVLCIQSATNYKYQAAIFKNSGQPLSMAVSDIHEVQSPFYVPPQVVSDLSLYSFVRDHSLLYKDQTHAREHTWPSGETSRRSVRKFSKDGMSVDNVRPTSPAVKNKLLMNSECAWRCEFWGTSNLVTQLMFNFHSKG